MRAQVCLRACDRSHAFAYVHACAKLVAYLCGCLSPCTRVCATLQPRAIARMFLHVRVRLCVRAFAAQLAYVNAPTCALMLVCILPCVRAGAGMFHYQVHHQQALR